MTEKHLHKIIILQHDQADCGVACLLSIVRYYKGGNSLERLRKLSGTGIRGTTLLGLYQAANSIGFAAEGCTANIEALKTHPSPVILHVTMHDTLHHYIVCFGTRQDKNGQLIFIIGDPAKGIVYMTTEELDDVWKSRSCLTLEPNEHFVTAKETTAAKRKWIVCLVKEDYPLLLMAMCMGVAIAGLGLTMAIFSQKLIDEILPQKNFEKLYVGIILVLLMLLAKEGLAALRQYFLVRQSKDFNIRIIDFFYRHLLHLPKPFFDTRKIGELTARLNDTSRIQRIISQLAGNSIIELLVVIVSIIFLISYSVQIGIAVTIIIPLLYFLVYRYNKAIIDGQKAVMTNYALTEANYISTLQGIEPVKNQNKQELFSVANSSIYKRYQDSVFSLGKIQIRLGFWANSFSVFFLSGVLLYGSSRVLNDHLTIGGLIAILSVCGTLLPGVASLALLSIPVNEAKIAFDRMFEFTAAEPEKDSETMLPLPVLESLKAETLSFRFAGKKRLLQDISFEVLKGEIIAIMGENGCGKSTLTQILQRHYYPEDGDILINNRPLSSFCLADWRDICTVVPQNIHIFNSTVLENIAYEKAASQPQDVIRFLNEAGFGFFMDSLPQSVMTLVGEEGINLSGGQKQMIALARALYSNPQLLILDEATSAMDREGEHFVLRLLNRLKPEMAIIYISHRLHVLKNLCDRIYILEDGTITAAGSHHQLLETKNLYSSYWADLVC
ncbi:MAG: peptidase domain-containing ABC transporter [Chitinophagaceae bacterium]|nr:peptidase domain-containing ABC transporter [Chitinophagaceae bacterium]MCW5929818.1 peptidase domain-containing ABC transporter [Chitinophagaceae bacterium]